ncbi:MAG TPA: diguanylate cyclase [Candidatus Aminicenantes bacterium]|nr:MAG: hypothetical protein C0168_09770 [Candidatus Aminicenantes bacterium]HEK85234.1 diguanylate cyclase [Candidatus Aminicenantes bacterium]
MARFGGDEFTILLGEINSLDGAQQIVQRMVQVFNQPIQIEGKSLTVTAILGVAIPRTMLMDLRSC